MGILIWTLGPTTVATMIAIAWVVWTSRPRGPVETHESVAAHERFKQAMSRTPAPRQPGGGPRPPAPRRPADAPTRRAS